MHTLFMNSRNSKTSDPQRLLLKISDKINFTLSVPEKRKNSIFEIPIIPQALNINLDIIR